MSKSEEGSIKISSKITEITDALHYPTENKAEKKLEATSGDEAQKALTNRSISLLQRLSQSLDLLSPTEKLVATYILKNHREVLRLPIDQLAREIGVSLGSLSNFCQTLGYSGFKEFKLDLATELKTPFQLDHSLINAGDSLEEIANKTVSASVDALLSTLKNLDKADLEKTIKLIRECQRIDIYGFGVSAVVGLDAYNRFFSLGLRANWLPDLSHQMVSATVLCQGDVAMAFSYSGESAITANALKLARENGAATIAVTGNRYSPVASQADIALLVFPREPTPFISNLHVSARTAMQVVVDMIYLGLLYSSETRLDKLDQVSTNVGSLRNYS